MLSTHEIQNENSVDKVEYGLRLLTRVGPAKTRLLFKHFKTLETIFAFQQKGVSEVIGPKASNQLFSKSDTALISQVKKTHIWLHDENNHFLTLLDKNYPKKLLDLSDSPPIVFMQGRIELLNSPSLAIVGSRSATRQGLYTAKLFAEVLTKCGFNIISGLADGIDGAAHNGSLAAINNETQESSTIAIMASGIDYIYPRSHENLAKTISKKGLIITEWPLGVSPRPSHFPQRNRLIASLSLGIIVIEAACHSGSLITARLANELGREVFAVPSSIYSNYSKGCHLLIKQGAKLVENVVDILEEIQLTHHLKDFSFLKKKIDSYLEEEKKIQNNLQKTASKKVIKNKELVSLNQITKIYKQNKAVASTDTSNSVPIKSIVEKHLIQNEQDQNDDLTNAQQKILNIMEFDPILFDDLLGLSKILPSELSVILFELEIKQLIERLPGNCYLKLFVN